MKRAISLLLIFVLSISMFCTDANAIDGDSFTPYVVDYIVTTDTNTDYENADNIRATGLIASYHLSLTKSGKTLNIYGLTQCSPDVVKCGFKNLTIQRRKNNTDAWDDYYEYGNVYAEAVAASLSTTLVVEAGYQYRISCKHYAKKNLLSIQTISNTSNIVTVS